VAHEYPFIIQERERCEHSPVKHWTTLSEVTDGDAFVVDAGSGFEIVDIDTSVIYYSRGSDGKQIFSSEDSTCYIFVLLQAG
jgi:hypothetical protein